jgi:lipoprotein NlpD
MPCSCFAIMVVALLLCSCASNPPAPVVDLSESNASSAPNSATGPAPPAATAGTYRVVRGDTLYAIAFRHGLDFRDVAAWNKIAPPYRIYAGQDLRLDAGGSGPRPPAGASAAVPHAPTATSATTTVTTPAAPSAGDSTSSKPGMFEDVTAAPATTVPVQKSLPAEPGTSVEAAPAATAQAARKPAPPESPPKSVAAEPAPNTAVADAATPPRVTEDSVANTNGVAWRWPGKGSLIGTFIAGDQTRQGIDVAGKAGDPVLAAADGEVVYSGNGLLGYGELIIVKHNANFLSAYGHNRKRLVQEGERVKAGQQIAEMGSSASARDELHFEIRKNGKPVNPIDYLPAR